MNTKTSVVAFLGLLFVQFVARAAVDGAPSNPGTDSILELALKSGTSAITTAACLIVGIRWLASSLDKSRELEHLARDAEVKSKNEQIADLKGAITQMTSIIAQNNVLLSRVDSALEDSHKIMDDLKHWIGETKP